MKFRFDPNLDFQREAINAVVDVFEGQEICRTNFTVAPWSVVGYLQNETKLTRRTLVEIMMRSGRLQDFKNNPQKYIEQVLGIIRHQMRSFELNDEVKVYAKLPGWFKIDTPLGSYNPDWAVLVEMDGQDRLYFVVESKGGLFPDALRPTEQAKIDCGREHFKALGADVRFTVDKSCDGFLDRVYAERVSHEDEEGRISKMKIEPTWR